MSFRTNTTENENRVSFEFLDYGNIKKESRMFDPIIRMRPKERKFVPLSKQSIEKQEKNETLRDFLITKANYTLT